MDNGLSEIARFLALRPPFDRLAPGELGEIATEATLEFYAAGATILSEDGGPVTFLRVVHSGAVDVVHEGRLLDLLGPGDAFGQAAMLSGLPPGFEARAAEDTLCYRIPDAAARPLLARARSGELAPSAREPAHQPVAELIRTATVTCPPGASVSEAARRMIDAGASATIVTFGDGTLGILTDRDLRGRVVAAGRAGETPVGEVATAPVFAVAPDMLGSELLYEMLVRGIRHAPVVSDGRLVGVVEDRDLFAGQARSWFGARRSIEQARDLDELAHAAGRLPDLMLALRGSSLRALEIVRVRTALTDAIASRALELARPGSGLPDEGVVFVAVGSQARRELTLTSPPRGAFVVGTGDRLAPETLAALGAALRRCGLPGQPVARSRDEWTRAAANDDLALAVLTDRRPLWGTPGEALPLVPAPAGAALLRALRERALTEIPPTGFDAESVLGLAGRREERLDIRRAATRPIVEMARWAATSAGAGPGATLQRLEVAAEAGTLPASAARTLADAFEVVLELRIAHQMDQLAAGLPPDDLLDPAAMTPVTRGHLRSVFQAVSAVQRELGR